MIKILLGILVLSVVVLGWVRILSNPETEDDEDYCYMCKMGWCDQIPHSKGCNKLRKENEQE